MEVVCVDFLQTSRGTAPNLGVAGKLARVWLGTIEAEAELTANPGLVAWVGGLGGMDGMEVKEQGAGDCGLQGKDAN